MAFNVVFYTYAKRQSSTATPSSGGKTISCMANNPLEVLAPEISLDWRSEEGTPTAYNYCHIPAFGRWYHITGWTHREGLWWAALRVDALASWKSALGAQSIYVYRASAAFNGRINDTLYPTTARFRRFRVTLPRMWSYGGATPMIEANGGYFVLGIIGQGTTRYYAMTTAELTTFLNAIFNDTYYTAVLGEFGAREYPEAKVAIDPLQYISSVRFWPCGFAPPSNAWALHITGQVGAIAVGPVSVQATAKVFTAAGAYPDQTSYNTTFYDVDLDTTDFRHPQADERGDYMQLAPWTHYELVYPPWGILELDPADLLDAETLRIRITADVRSGSALLTVSTLRTVGRSTLETIISRSIANVGINCPLSKFQQTGSGTITRIGDIMSGVAGLFRDPAEAVRASFSSDVQGRVPHLSTVSSEGSGAAMSGDPCLAVTHQYAATDDVSDFGRPLMDKRRISSISGYIKGDSDEISIACTAPELEEIRAAVAGGFWYV